MTPQKSMYFPLLLAAYEIVNYLSNDMMLPALPTMKDDLGLTIGSVQLTITVWFLGMASMPLFAGAITDYFGRRQVLITSGVVYIASSMLCAVTSHAGLFLLARFIEGCMVTFMIVSGYAIVHEQYSHKDAIRILAIMSGISVLAPALGPLAGAITLLVTDWRGIFWFIALSGAILLADLIRVTPRTEPLKQTITMRKLFHHYKVIFTNRDYLRYVSMIGCIFGGFIAWITGSPLLLIEHFGMTVIHFGVIQCVIFGIYIIASYSVHCLIDRFSVQKIVQLGLLCTLTGGLLLGAVTFLYPENIFLFLLCISIYSFGSGLCFAPCNRLAIETNEEPMGMRVAGFTLTITLCASLASGLISVFFQNGISTSRMAAIITPAAILAAGMAAFKKRVMTNAC